MVFSLCYILVQYEIRLLDVLLALKADCVLDCNSDSAASSLRDVGFPLCWHLRDHIWAPSLVWGSLKPRQATTEGSEPSGATKLVGAGAWDVRGEAESWGCAAGEGKGGSCRALQLSKGRLWRRRWLLARGKGHKLPQGKFPTDSRKVSPHEGGQTWSRTQKKVGISVPWSHSNLAGTLPWATCPQLALLRVGV